jgi:XTP/dITP diphosphohydrolase
VAEPLILYAATSNQGKLAEFRAAARQSRLPVAIEPAPGIAALPTCLEDGESFEENARKKAEYYSRCAGGLVFGDDSGLEVAALGGAPGVRSARYSGPQADDARNNAALLEALRGVPAQQRQARFVSVIAVAEAGRVLAGFQGEAAGVLLEAPRGHNGFGYDPLFFVPELGHTFAELTADEKLLYSHRGRAFRALLSWLAEKHQP